MAASPQSLVAMTTGGSEYQRWRVPSLELTIVAVTTDVSSNMTQIVVKFTRRYGIELHSFWDAHPRSLAISDFLETGSPLIAMDYLPSALPISVADDRSLDEHQTQWAAARMCINSFHDQGWRQRAGRCDSISCSVARGHVLVIEC